MSGHEVSTKMVHDAPKLLLRLLRLGTNSPGLALVMVRFGSVRLRGYFARTLNQNIGSVQQFP